MKLFKKSNKEKDPLKDYVEQCRKMGVSEEEIKKNFIDKGYSQEVINSLFKPKELYKPQLPKVELENPVVNKVSSDIQEELKKIPRKQRKKALRLLEEYHKGLVLIVDKDIDNKELINSIRRSV
jgi:hypothetical protein